MTSLVIGASGQVGALLYRYAARQGGCVGTYCNHEVPGLRQLDLRDHRLAEALVKDVRPSVCYVPAALTHVDYAEQHPDACYAINVWGVANLARALSVWGGTLVFFSTDHVFGDGAESRREHEPTQPKSVYAETKVFAERVVADTLPHQHLILRTSWVYGPDPQRKNFVYQVRRALAKNKSLVVASDQYGQPTYAPDLARVALELAAREASGVYHVVGPQSISRLTWARMIATASGYWGQSLLGQPTGFFDTAAPRTLHVRLDRQRLLNFLGQDPIRAPADGIRALVEGWNESMSRAA